MVSLSAVGITYINDLNDSDFDYLQETVRTGLFCEVSTVITGLYDCSEVEVTDDTDLLSFGVFEGTKAGC